MGSHLSAVTLSHAKTKLSPIRPSLLPKTITYTGVSYLLVGMAGAQEMYSGVRGLNDYYTSRKHNWYLWDVVLPRVGAIPLRTWCWCNGRELVLMTLGLGVWGLVTA